MAVPIGSRPNGYELVQETEDYLLLEDDFYLMWDGTWDFTATDAATGTDTLDYEGTDFAPEGFKMVRLVRTKYTLKLK